MTQSLLSKQDPDKIDTISGATYSSASFKELAKATVEKAKIGNQSKTVLSSPKE